MTLIPWFGVAAIAPERHGVGLRSQRAQLELAPAEVQHEPDRRGVSISATGVAITSATTNEKPWSKRSGPTPSTVGWAESFASTWANRVTSRFGGTTRCVFLNFLA